jgi:hypothetical protein
VRFAGPVIRAEWGEILATTESSFVSAGTVDDIGNNMSDAKTNLTGFIGPLGVVGETPYHKCLD